MGYSIEGIGGIRKGIVHQCVDHSEYFKFYRLIICLTIEKIGGIVESEKTNNFRLFIYIYISFVCNNRLEYSIKSNRRDK